MKRVHNVIRPKGPSKPSPRYVVDQVYRYRGREIELERGGSWGGGWWWKMTVVDPETRARLEAANVSAQDVFSRVEAPDMHVALRWAMFTADAQERIAERGFGDLWEAMSAVRNAIDDLTGLKQPLTRANVARIIQVQANDNRRRSGSTIRGEEAEAFERLPLDERVELIEEMLEMAHAYGGRYPNPRQVRAQLLAF